MAMKSYPPEFKADAVALYLSDPGRTLASVAEDLGISPATVAAEAVIAGAAACLAASADVPTAVIAATLEKASSAETNAVFFIGFSLRSDSIGLIVLRSTLGTRAPCGRPRRVPPPGPP